MHYGIFCPEEKCRKLAFRLRPGLRPDDLANQPLTMGCFVGTHPMGAIICPHCKYIFKATDFRVENLTALG